MEGAVPQREGSVSAVRGLSLATPVPGVRGLSPVSACLYLYYEDKIP
jgi:hypothetical protein